MLATIKELQSQGYDLPNYPEDPKTPEEIRIQNRYNRAKGSAVNPVLRDGNSDRRAPKPVKKFAQNNPHWMGEWSPESKSHVSSMSHGDFYGTEESCTVPEDCSVDIIFQDKNGTTSTLKAGLRLQKDEVIDAAFMSTSALRDFWFNKFVMPREKAVVLGSSESNHDESSIHHFWTCYSNFYKSSNNSRRAGRYWISSQQRHWRFVCKDGSIAEKANEIITDAIKHCMKRTSTRDGKLRQRHHQPSCSQQCHHRCLHARIVAYSGKMRDNSSRTKMPVYHPRSVLCNHIPRGHRFV